MSRKIVDYSNFLPSEVSERIRSYIYSYLINRSTHDSYTHISTLSDSQEDPNLQDYRFSPPFQLPESLVKEYLSGISRSSEGEGEAVGHEPAQDAQQPLGRREDGRVYFSLKQAAKLLGIEKKVLRAILEKLSSKTGESYGVYGVSYAIPEEVVTAISIAKSLYRDGSYPSYSEAAYAVLTGAVRPEELEGVPTLVSKKDTPPAANASVANASEGGSVSSGSSYREKYRVNNAVLKAILQVVSLKDEVSRLKEELTEIHSRLSSVLMAVLSVDGSLEEVHGFLQSIFSRSDPGT